MNFEFGLTILPCEEKLNLHYKKSHQKSKVHIKCQVCEQIFENKKYLKTHQQVHKNISCFFCYTCDKSFAPMSSLISHMDSYHSLQIFASWWNITFTFTHSYLSNIGRFSIFLIHKKFIKQFMLQRICFWSSVGENIFMGNIVQAWDGVQISGRNWLKLFI